MTETVDIVDQAIEWHMRQGNMPEHAWREFMAWLEADAAHARAYDAVALDLALLGQHPDLLADSAPAANDDAHQFFRRTWLFPAAGLAAAAALAVMIVPMVRPHPSDPYTVTTQPGEQRDVALADGTRIELNGGSSVTLDHANPRVATLDTGEATFHVRHDASDPFVLRSGKVAVQDLGTVFNVVREGARIDVEVAEGSVLYQPELEAVTLRAGSALSAREDLGSVSVSPIAVERVGGWRNKSLTFSGDSLAQVAASIRRLDGATLEVDAGLSSQPFTGMLRLSGKAERDVPHVAALIGARWRHDGERWILSPLDSGTR